MMTIMFESMAVGLRGSVSGLRIRAKIELAEKSAPIVAIIPNVGTTSRSPSMNRMLLIVSLCAVTTVCASQTRPMTFEDMFTMDRISQLALSPSGDRLLMRVTQADLDANTMHSAIFLVDLKDGAMRCMTPEGESHSSPVWHPAGSGFAYVSGSEIFINALDGSAPRRVTQTKGSSPLFSPDGTRIAFISSVDVKSDGDHSGKLIDALMFRHWNEWTDQTRTHLFLVDADGSDNPAVDITPDASWVPPISLGSSQDIAFSPNGSEIAYVTNPDEVVATSTNNDVFVYEIATGERRQITTAKGVDIGPAYSPDGRFLAYQSMARPGFEADQTQIWIYDRRDKSKRNLNADFKYAVSEMIWRPDSSGLIFSAQVEGAKSLFSVDLKGTTKRLTDTYVDTNPGISSDGKTLVFARQATTMPNEVFAMDMKTKAVRQVSDVNGDVLSELDMQPWEPFWFDSPNGDPVQGFVVKPPAFDAGTTYPMIFLIHGGPQGMWSNDFHYRWNAQMFAAPGYVAVLVNPHGSKGYGQPFCDAVSRDWGGLPYEDLMTGLKVALERFDYIDSNRIGAAGASYGGYMVNWIATREHPFKALVSHDGVYNLPSMYGTTEELWFPEWEFAGTYYENPELFEKWSPHRYAKGLHAPMLVIHSELDFRVPLNQGIELFTAHQRQGIPSRWLYFPDEDHFVSKPKNARMWWATVHGWFKQYLKPGP